jgi:hypothetical protein
MQENESPGRRSPAMGIPLTAVNIIKKEEEEEFDSVDKLLEYMHSTK